MAKIRRRYYGPRNDEQKDIKYGKRVGPQGSGQQAYAEKKGRKGK
jgi:hypothetical protein